MILGMRVEQLWSEGWWFWWPSLKLTLKTLHESQCEEPSEFWLTSWTCYKENWVWGPQLLRARKYAATVSPVRDSSHKTRESLIHTIEHVSVSAREPLLCHRCVLLFLSQPSGSEKVGTLTRLFLIPTLKLGVTLAHLEALCVCVLVCETP